MPRPRMKGVEHVAGILARVSHRGRDHRLAFGIADLFQRITNGSITQEVWPCGTPNSAPST